MSATAAVTAPVYLVRGDDPALVAQAAHRLVASLVGDDDPGLVVEELGGPSSDALDVGAVVDACTTPPFLVPRRVVVVRDAGRLVAADGARLVQAMADPPPSTVLVLVAGGGTVPQALSKLASSVGGLVDTTVGIGRARSQWLSDHLRDGPVRLDAAAAARLGDHLGGDMGRLSGLLDTLAAAYGPGATVHVDELEPFLGEVGSAAPWDLTDAIDGGDIPGALDALHRLLGSGSHPLQVMASLHTHYRRMLVLDGAGVTSQEAAAELLGTKPFPAKKAMTQGRRLGSAGIARAFRLLAAADLDLRGGTAMPGETVLDVLVARLAQRVGRSR